MSRSQSKPATVLWLLGSKKSLEIVTKASSQYVSNAWKDIRTGIPQEITVTPSTPYLTTGTAWPPQVPGAQFPFAGPTGAFQPSDGFQP